MYRSFVFFTSGTLHERDKTLQQNLEGFLFFICL